MSKTPPLTILASDEGEWTRLAMKGPINEEAKAVLAPWLAKEKKKLILDMAGITFLNSCGIRDWSHFLKALKTDREIIFDRLTDEVVRTMNMVTNFHFKLPVRSVFRSYGCEACGHEQTELFSEGKEYDRGAIPATVPKICGKCGKETEAYEPDEEFFQFLMIA